MQNFKYVVIFGIKTITTIFQILLYTGIFSTVLPLLFYLFFKSKTKNKIVRVILFYVLYCIFNEALSYYLQSIQSPKFITLLFSFTVIEYSFICYFFYLTFPKEQIKRIILFLWISFLVFAFIDFFYINESQKFDSIASGIESLIIITVCVYFIFSQIKGVNNLVIYSTFSFWIAVSFLIYFSGTFFLYILTENMMKDLEFQKLYFIINIAFNVLKNILLSIAMTMKVNSILKSKESLPDLDEDLFFQKTN